MANFYIPSTEEEEGWAAFLSGAPERVREAVKDFPPWKLLRLRDTDFFCVSVGMNVGQTLVALIIYVPKVWNKKLTSDCMIHHTKPRDLFQVRETDVPPLIYTIPSDVIFEGGYSAAQAYAMKDEKTSSRKVLH